MASVDVGRETIEFYDSMTGSKAYGQSVLDNIRRYLQDEWQDKVGRVSLSKSMEAPSLPTPANVDVSLQNTVKDVCAVEQFRTWTMNNVPACPRQKDGSSCGVFVCFFARCVSASEELNFGQSQVNALRKKMAFDLLSPLFYKLEDMDSVILDAEGNHERLLDQ
jgi:Ulp1 family protease